MGFERKWKVGHIKQIVDNFETVKILVLKEQTLHFCIRLDMRMEVEYPQEVIFANFVLYFWLYYPHITTKAWGGGPPLGGLHKGFMKKENSSR